ncbi:MAG: TonB-dependent receptor [Chitinophagaceae bacterium]|nr:MAG: TonB-dependent receptor [Chitinophagaceae bacterium]
MATGFTATAVHAQRDSTQSIDITSSFKPVLRNAVKINFSGSQLAADTSRPSLGYTIPAQNLFYTYQPISLKPLALVQDTNLYLGNRNYLKAGFGSYTTPYLAVGFGLGDGKKSLVNLSASYIGSKGTDIEFQDYNMLQVKGTGSYFTGKNEVYGGAAVSLNNYYLYGYDKQLYNYTKADVRQQFQDISVNAGVRNTSPNEAEISYNPNLQFSFFTNKNRLSETSIVVDLPAEKRINDQIILKLSAKGDFTNYATKGLLPNNYDFANNILQVTPAFKLSNELINLHGGVTPTWNNGTFSWLPDVYAEVKLQERVFLLQAGWVGRYTKNSYRNLSAINPYLGTLTEQRNTRETEYYAGIKATLGSHFNFNAKVGWLTYKDFALFINDTASDEKSFDIVYEPKAKNLRVHGDVSYVNQDKFTVTAGLTLNGYTGFNVNNKAWHTLPMEFTSSIKWWAFEKLLMKGDLYFFNGGNYITKTAGSKPLQGGTDLSIGAEYKINKQFSAWLNANNLLNDKYQRWNNYQVYGLNLTGGVLINF